MLQAGIAARDDGGLSGLERLGASADFQGKVRLCAEGLGRVIGQSSLLAFLNERLLSATSGHRIDFKDRALMINKSVALPDQIFARPELA